VIYSTSNGTAIAGSDYIPVTGTLTFEPGITTRTFTVTIIDDKGEEITETLFLTLSNPVSATLGTPNPATLSIIDDDTGAGICDGQPPMIRPIAIGEPDCFWTYLSPISSVTVDLGATPIIVSGDTDFDLVYYERESPPPPRGSIALDLVRVEVSTDSVTFYEVFNWGNAVTDINTNIGQSGYGPPEVNDQLIPMSNPPLYGPPPAGIISGIAIDVDNPPAGSLLPGSYRYVRITATGAPGDDAEIDSIEVLP